MFIYFDRDVDSARESERERAMRTIWTTAIVVKKFKFKKRQAASLVRCQSVWKTTFHPFEGYTTTVRCERSHAKTNPCSTCHTVPIAAAPQMQRANWSVAHVDCNMLCVAWSAVLHLLDFLRCVAPLPSHAAVSSSIMQQQIHANIYALCVCVCCCCFSYTTSYNI